MKNTFKLIGIIAIAAVIGLTFAACNLDEGNDDVQKYIEITGITITTGKVTVGICDSGTTENDIKAVAQGDAKSTVKVPLVSTKTEKQYTGTGDWYILLIFDKGTESKADDENYAYAGGGSIPITKNIKDETTRVAFADFVKLQK